MSDHLHFFQTPVEGTALVLPFPLEDLVRDWAGLRSVMIRRKPEAFTRDEWAYLIAFLDPEALARVFESSFGLRVALPSASIGRLARPRGRVAVWLPSNVSLLGPLTLILLGLTGNAVRFKGGSRAQDLTGQLLEFALSHLGEGPLRAYLSREVRHDVFERGDPRNREMAAEADVRIVFGTREAAASVHAMDHPAGSVGFSFVDRRSEAWLEPAACTDQVLGELVRVFAIYGAAGCTSPRRVVLIGGTAEEAERLRDRLVDAWIRMRPGRVAMHQASENILAHQWAAAKGWASRLAPDSGVVFASASISSPAMEGMRALGVVWGTREEAVATLPGNIQTIGCAFANPRDPAWIGLMARTRVRRVVPVSRMHHFGPLWDGEDFWRQCFLYSTFEIG